MANKESKLIKESYSLARKLINTQTELLKLNKLPTTPALVAGNVLLVVVEEINEQSGVNRLRSLVGGKHE